VESSLLSEIRKRGTARSTVRQVRVFPTIGHSRLTYPHRAWQEDSAFFVATYIDAQGATEFAAYEAKLAFLRRVLR
jgi:hypothetical protein